MLLCFLQVGFQNDGQVVALWVDLYLNGGNVLESSANVSLLKQLGAVLDTYQKRFCRVDLTHIIPAPVFFFKSSGNNISPLDKIYTASDVGQSLFCRPSFLELEASPHPLYILIKGSVKLSLEQYLFRFTGVRQGDALDRMLL